MGWQPLKISSLVKVPKSSKNRKLPEIRLKFGNFLFKEEQKLLQVHS